MQLQRYCVTLIRKYCNMVVIVTLCFRLEVIMGFTTQLFIFIFFPIAALSYYLCYFLSQKIKFFQKIRATDIVLVVLSFSFYAWAFFDDVLWLCAYVGIVYIAGRIVQALNLRKVIFVTSKTDNPNTQGLSVALIGALVSAAIFICILVAMKYSNITTAIWNFIMRDSLTPKSVLAPLGLSFITFSAISYVVDIYKGKVEAGNLLDCALYISFFPSDFLLKSKSL